VSRRAIAVGLVLAFVAGALILYAYGRSLWVPILRRIAGRRTVEQVVAELREAEARLAARFVRAGGAYPPRSVILVGLKAERRLELWADGRHVADYAVLAASGGPGPKLRDGDRQVPEGIYAVEGLNPNSSYHLSIKLDYPNAGDRAQAARDGRADLGGDIFIHGKAASIGCLAMGDEAIEELFLLVATVGRENVRVVLVPRDLTVAPEPQASPPWVAALYRDLADELRRLRADP
jgi:hypothetical protein